MAFTKWPFQLSPLQLRLVDGADDILLKARQPTPNDAVLCTFFDPGAPEAREATVPLSGLDGANDSTGYSGARAVTMDLVVLGSEEEPAYLLAERLASLAHPGRRPWLYASRPAPVNGVAITDGEWRMALRGTPWALSYGKRAATRLEMRLSFVAPLGYWQSAEPRVERIYAGGIRDDRLIFPVTFPFHFGWVGGRDVEVWVTSRLPVPPKLYAYGPATDPSVELPESGEGFAFSGLVLAEGQYVEVDMSAGTVRLNGEPADSLYDRVDWSRSTFWQLRPGRNIIRYSSGGGQLTLEWHERRSTI